MNRHDARDDAGRFRARSPAEAHAAVLSAMFARDQAKHTMLRSHFGPPSSNVDPVIGLNYQMSRRQHGLPGVRIV
jgi:hypothetical protein